jgi:hypothetical protein
MASAMRRASVTLRQKINHLGAESGVHPTGRPDVLLLFSPPERSPQKNAPAESQPQLGLACAAGAQVSEKLERPSSLG